jgi:methylmalonyl-CoA/ethylmalonyl-CoA epimerase
MNWALHHIGYLTDALEAEAARWEADFGYERDGPIFEDATQTARVCFLRQPGAGHWLELVSPWGESSKLARAVQQKVTLHHLCYETADLLSALESLRARGWLPLGVPVPAVAFNGRLIAWAMDERRTLIELVQAGPGRYRLDSLCDGKQLDR